MLTFSYFRCVCPKSSNLKSLRQGTYTGRRSAMNLLLTSNRNLPGSPYLRYIQLLRTSWRSSSPSIPYCTLVPSRTAASIIVGEFRRFSLSPWCHRTLSDAKAVNLRSKGILALAYLDGSWLSNFRASHGRLARGQWLAAGEATHGAMLVSFLCGQFLSAKKCDFRPARQQQYLGMVCDLNTATFRVPQEKQDELKLLLRAAVDGRQLNFRALQRIADKCMSMTVAIRRACGDRGPREVRLVHCRFYARLTG